jgi:hypothetical protein
MPFILGMTISLSTMAGRSLRIVRGEDIQTVAGKRLRHELQALRIVVDGEQFDARRCVHEVLEEPFDFPP